MKLEQIAAVVALLLLSCPARASASTDVQGRSFSVLSHHDLTRLDDGAVGGTFSTVGVFPRFNPAMGALTSVDVKWYFQGYMEVGIFPARSKFSPRVRDR